MTDTTQTCFDAGDMADAQAKAFREGVESAGDTLAALQSMFNEHGEFEYNIETLGMARAAIAKHDHFADAGKPISDTTTKDQA